MSAGFLFLVGSTGWTYRFYRYAEAIKHFALCKEAKDLRPEDLDFRKQKPGTPPNPDYRPFNDTYIPRKAVASHATPRTTSVSDAPMEEPMLVNLLRTGQGLVFIGPPGAGKTLLLFSLLRNFGPCLVLQPRRDQSLPPDDAFHLLKGRQVVVLLNDLDGYANHPPDLQKFCTKARAHALSGSIGIAATCRDGKALSDITGNSLRRLYEDSLLPLTLVRLPQPEQRRLATSVNRPWQQDYATPGDIVMAEMRDIMPTRYDHDLSLDCQDVLQALKLLTAAKLALTTARMRVVMQHVFEKSLDLRNCLRLLADQSFLDKRSLPATIEPEPYYLDKIVPYPRAKDEPATDFPLLMLALEDLQDADGLYTLGRVFAEREDRMNAWACFGKVAALQADFPETLYTNADEAYDAARYHEALELYDYLLLLQPENYEVWNNKGVALADLGRHREALTAYDRALQLQPNLAGVWKNNGLRLADLGHHVEALTAYDCALQLQPDFVIAWYNKGMALADLGRPDALAAFERVVELKPDDIQAWRQVVRLAAAQGDLVKAEKARLEVLRLEREERDEQA